MIRRAVVADKAAVLRMARDFHTTSGVPFGFDAARASVLFDVSLIDNDKICLVVDVAEKLSGVLAAQYHSHPLCGARFAMEAFWWLSPRYWRRLPTLLTAYEEWARDNGCATAGMAMLGGNLSLKSFQRAGYAAAERVFYKFL